jgi:hypothetical protein
MKLSEFKMVEPLKSNRWIISFNNDVEVPEYLFNRYKIKNEGGDLVLTTRMFNTVHYSFNPADLFKITEVTIKYLDPIGEVVNGLVLPIKGSNVEIKCSYKDDNLMFTNFRFIIDVEKMSPLYKNNIHTTENEQQGNGK